MSHAGELVDARRKALAHSLASRFWLRFHMSVMLFAALSHFFPGAPTLGAAFRSL